MSYSVFLQHLADALSIPTTTSLPAILTILCTLPTLLVIDNAETFLDLDTADGGYISEAIAEVGGCPSVHLILTTRSGKLPNLSWVRQNVGGLDIEASRALFSAVYERDIGNHLDSLFSTLDHHALSIALLSHAATRNAYQNTQEIQLAWEQQKTSLLMTGPAKSQNLRVTIEFSLDSPSLRAMQAEALAFLRTVAFLPEGVHRDDLSGIFSEYADIQAVVNAVCLSSLTHRSAERITVLAPIRMYIMEHYNAALSYEDPVLVSIRNYLYQQLSAQPESWVVRESTNAERLLSFDLTSEHVQHDDKARLRTLMGVVDLHHALSCYHPRETSMFPLLQSVSEHRHIPQAARVVGRQHSGQLILAKAKCLNGICSLQYRLRRNFIQNDMLEIAELFCRRHMPICNKQLLSCLRLKGAIYQRKGDLLVAYAALCEASALAQSLKDRPCKVLLDHSLSRILFLRGRIAETTSLMASVEGYFRPNNQHVHLAALLLDRINFLMYEKDFDIARKILDQAEKLDRKHNRGRRSRNLLNWKASVEGCADNTAAAMKILDEATKDEIRPGMLEFDQYVEAWRGKAYYAAISGNFDNARKNLAQVVGLALPVGVKGAWDTLLAAYIELYSGERDKAKELLVAAQAEDSHGHMQLTGFIHRALGEVALLNGDENEAAIHFSHVGSMCGTSGMSAKFLYANQWQWYSLSADYVGWTKFLDRAL